MLPSYTSAVLYFQLYIQIFNGMAWNYWELTLKNFDFWFMQDAQIVQFWIQKFQTLLIYLFKICSTKVKLACRFITNDCNGPAFLIFNIFLFSVKEQLANQMCNPEEIDSCPFGGMCVLNSDGKADCLCEDTCSLNINPVCGSDAKSYDNECFLRLNSCRKRAPINVLHAGECGKLIQWHFLRHKNSVNDGSNMIWA